MHLVLQLDFVICKCHMGGSSFEGMKGSGRIVEAWHYESSGKAIGEGVASVAVDSPKPYLRILAGMPGTKT